MLYSALVDNILFDYMYNGITINLKSLLNSIMSCEDVGSIGMYHDGDLISHKSEIKDMDKERKYRHRYMSGYMEDTNYKLIYNNAGIRIYDKEDRELGSLWFGEEHMLSREKNRDRYGNEINDYDIRWTTDTVYIILINRTAVDSKVIFEEGEALC